MNTAPNNADEADIDNALGALREMTPEEQATAAKQEQEINTQKIADNYGEMMAQTVILEKLKSGLQGQETKAIIQQGVTELRAKNPSMTVKEALAHLHGSFLKHKAELTTGGLTDQEIDGVVDVLDEAGAMPEIPQSEVQEITETAGEQTPEISAADSVSKKGTSEILGDIRRTLEAGGDFRAAIKTSVAEYLKAAKDADPAQGDEDALKVLKDQLIEVMKTYDSNVEKDPKDEVSRRIAGDIDSVVRTLGGEEMIEGTAADLQNPALKELYAKLESGQLDQFAAGDELSKISMVEDPATGRLVTAPGINPNEVALMTKLIANRAQRRAAGQVLTSGTADEQAAGKQDLQGIEDDFDNLKFGT